MMEWTINSLEEFERIIQRVPYLAIIPMDKIKKYLPYKPIIIKEEDNARSIMATIKLKKPDAADRLRKELLTIRKQLMKYLRATLLEKKENRIETLRKKAVVLKKELGDNWYEDECFNVDKYDMLREYLVNKEKADIPIVEWICVNKRWLCDNYTDGHITFGKKFAAHLSIIARQADQDIREIDLGPLIYILFNRLPYKNITANFKQLCRLNLGISEMDIKLSNKNYFINNLTCNSLGEKMEGGNLTLTNSSINQLLYHAKDINKVALINCQLFEQPFINAQIKDKKITATKYFHKKNLNKPNMDKELTREQMIIMALTGAFKNM